MKETTTNRRQPGPTTYTFTDRTQAVAAITLARQAKLTGVTAAIVKISARSSDQGVTERGDASDVIGGLRTCIGTRRPIRLTFALVYSTQKSGLSAAGIAEYVPGNHSVFSAQTSSRHSSKARRNVKVADQGIVKAPLSSTVRWICSPLPL
jgi:hypothetical protein